MCSFSCLLVLLDGFLYSADDLQKDQSDLSHKKPVTVIAKAITTTMKAATKAKKRSHSVITEEMNDVENLASQSLVSKKNHRG